MFGASRRLVLAAVLVGPLVLTGCGNSGVRYVTNSERGLFIKVPDDWERFDIDADERPESRFSRPWRVFLDAAPDPTIEHMGVPALDDPVGVVSIVPLTLNRPRDEISLSFLRALSIDSSGQQDPLTLIEDGDDSVELVDYDELTNSDGYWGVELVVNARQEDAFVTIGHLAMVDPGLRHVYILQISCASSCYENNRAEIDRIFESWTIEER
ncbi:hypothetical protein BH18ACT4_BH18ACT4_07890 [soil metagenome]